MTKVLIISASESDLPVMEGAAKVLEEFGVEHEMAVSSAHRSPDRTVELVKKFHEEGGKVIIAGAGLAALLATMQMPPGVPVATVAINGAKNAGFLAVQILATSDSSLEKKLIDYKQKLAL